LCHAPFASPIADFYTLKISNLHDAKSLPSRFFEVHRTNKELAPFEAVRDFLILDRDFTVAGEELTPTLKPRRQVIVERYKDLIEDMYRKAS
jgi:long-chain acyl-CoA synthetase